MPKPAGGDREGGDKVDSPVKTRHVTFQLEPEIEGVKAGWPPRGPGLRKRGSDAGPFLRKGRRGGRPPKKERGYAGGAGSGK